MKPEKVAALTDTELLKRKKLLKSTHTFIVATGIVALLILCVMFGYSVGKDVATGGKGTFYLSICQNFGKSQKICKMGLPRLTKQTQLAHGG